MVENQQVKRSFLEIPAKVQQWADDYAAHLTDDLDYNQMLSEDLANEIDELATPALLRAYCDGIITKDEYIKLGGEVWAVWADFTNKAKNRRTSWIRRALKKLRLIP